MFRGLEWGTLLIQIQQLSAAFSISFNIFLIHLIVNKSPKQIGVYKYFMLYFSIFEIFYGIVTALTSPFHHTQYATYSTIISSKDRALSHFVLNILNAVYWACYGISVAMFAIQFIYRYLATVKSDLARSFQSWKILLWFSLPLVFGTVWAVAGYVFCAPTQEVTDFIKNSIHVTFGLEESEFVYLGPRIFKEHNGTITFNIKPSIGLALNIMTMNISFFAILFFGLKCYYYMRKMMSQSGSSKSIGLQRQLFFALVVQTLIPVVLMLSPFTFALILCIFDINDDVIGGIVVLCIAIYPAIDPLPNIFIIRDYRRALLYYVLRVKNKLFCKTNVISASRNTSCYVDGQISNATGQRAFSNVSMTAGTI
ncbi:Serpentine receptor class r-10 [Caenorhabditis elegans]|uniref:Serpentine receptor class r-10 n=1 Tax=Caenorhabditis elegans TaxID=6239 RepID=Q966B3_CAEEL|nr:Seven TM Receptor [Caenorhabditis elegans]CCD69581.1 Seven TM Receptor [Caenorhabditis elegans]|eukprot:NP_503465.2 Seven TM Receptor [Caenorhabditis elegans]